MSELASALDADVAAWRERPRPAGGYPSLCVGARHEHVRVAGQAVSQGMLIVAAVRDDGRRGILAVDVADTESEATDHDLLRRLTQRRLAGVPLVTLADHAGLRAAVARHFQGASWQHGTRAAVRAVAERAQVRTWLIGRPLPAGCIRA